MATVAQKAKTVQTKTISLTSNQIAGNSNLLFINSASATFATGVADTALNSYSAVYQSSVQGQAMEVWVANNIAATIITNTITTTDTTTPNAMVALEVSGLISSPFDSASSSILTATTTPSIIGTPTVNNDFLVGFTSDGATTYTFTVGSPASDFQQTSGSTGLGTPGVASADGNIIGGAGVGQTVSFTSSASKAFNIIAATFKTSGSVVGTVVSPLSILGAG